MSRRRTPLRLTGAALLAGLCLSMFATPGHARPVRGPACAGCHGNPVLGSTPGDGGTLNLGNTLVGQSSSATYTLRNTSTVAPLGGGFQGSFPNTPAGSEFGAPANRILTGDVARAPGYLTPQQGSESRLYTYTPTARGTDSVQLSFTPGAGYLAGTVPTITVNLQGKGVAPVVGVDTSQADAGAVRLGTSGNARVTVQNTGDGNLSGLGAVSNLKGGIDGSAGVFAGPGGAIDLADGASAAFDYTFTPVARGSASQPVNIAVSNGSADGSNQSEALSASLSGTGVGPSFAASVAPGGTIDFGQVFQPASVPLTVSNSTSDDGAPDLTRLTLLFIDISGPGAARFDLSGFTSGMTLDKGASAGLTVGFLPGAAKGLYTATMRLDTDQGSALGAGGESFTFNLQAEVIPEPETWALLAAGLAGVGIATRRRRALRPL